MDVTLAMVEARGFEPLSVAPPLESYRCGSHSTGGGAGLKMLLAKRLEMGRNITDCGTGRAASEPIVRLY